MKRPHWWRYVVSTGSRGETVRMCIYIAIGMFFIFSGIWAHGCQDRQQPAAVPSEQIPISD